MTEKYEYCSTFYPATDTSVGYVLTMKHLNIQRFV